MDNKGSFSYWKTPWVKWLFLAAGAAQILLIVGKRQEYRLTVESGLFSPEQLSEYLIQQKFSCMINVLIALLFFGAVLIGFLVRRKKSAVLAETILAFAIALIYTVGLILWGTALPSIPLWIIFLCMIWGCWIFTLYQFLKEVRKH